MDKPLVMIRGGGELASGVAHRLFMCGFRPVILELPEPRMVRRTVCFADAIYRGEYTVEGVNSRMVSFPVKSFENFIPVIVDPAGETIPLMRPHILIDARMRKRDVDLSLNDAPLVIGLGPGIEVGRHAHAVIETKRGHAIGRVYREGMAIPDTGIPGEIEGMTIQRLLVSPDSGIFENILKIGDRVSKGTVVARVGNHAINAAFDGVLRGLLKDGLAVKSGEKVGDIDPRQEINVHTISDKARAVGGGVLEAIFSSLPWTIKVP